MLPEPLPMRTTI
ncbi:UNVERIFIED_CONTAM: hypothetical protein GTU68_026245 [Idotea baltica]|nr:hypothetical protein [Idotea baltica]